MTQPVLNGLVSTSFIFISGPGLNRGLPLPGITGTHPLSDVITTGTFRVPDDWPATGGLAAADILRVTISGPVDDDGGLVEASVVGDRNGTQEPTMFFRHGDFVEVEDD